MTTRVRIFDEEKNNIMYCIDWFFSSYENKNVLWNVSIIVPPYYPINYVIILCTVVFFKYFQQCIG